MSQVETIDNPILQWWQRCQRLPAGAWLFSRFLGWYAPYSGSIRARVEALDPGYARVRLTDRRAVRNHLTSIHAIALVNLGEIATGLAVLSTISDNMRGILVGIEAEYVKKARGQLIATASFELTDSITENTPCQVEALLTDSSGDLVTRVTANWMIGPRA